MTTADLIYKAVQPLPELLAREVLDFVNFLSLREAGRDTANLSGAQSQSQAMRDWDNPDDEIWNDRHAG